MEGQQSDRDVILYEKAAANIGNANVPVPNKAGCIKNIETITQEI